MKYRHDILAVIVLYKQQLSQSSTFISLSKSLITNNITCDLFVYDNSPGSGENQTDQHYNNWNITYYADILNGGVSKAYNKAAEVGYKAGKKWILLLDQDTNFPVQTIDKYLSAIDTYPGEKLFAPKMLTDTGKIISPCVFKYMRGFPSVDIKAGINSFTDISVINCGMCVDIASLRENGGYNEQIKLDFSDHDFIRRFNKNITNNFVVIDLAVNHGLSSETKNSFLSDLNRFDFYLDGLINVTANRLEKLFLFINALIRAIKLCLTHQSFDFLKKTLKQYFKK